MNVVARAQLTFQMLTLLQKHYSDVIVSILASRITGDSTVCLSVCLDEHQRKYQSPRHWPFVRGIHVVVNGRFPLTKGHLSGNRFNLMTSRHKNARYWPNDIPVSVPDSYKNRMSYKNQLPSPVIVHIGSCCMETLFRITVPLWSSGLRLISITITPTQVMVYHWCIPWFIPAAARARGQSNDLNREILASNLFNCHKEVINGPPVPSISRCIHIVYRHKNVWEYQLSNFIYICMSTCLHYDRCKDALLDCSAPGGERCESLTWVDEIGQYSVVSVSYLLWAWTNCWVYNRVSDLRFHDAHTTSL